MTMRHCWLIGLILLALVMPTSPAHAEVVTIEPPEDTEREPILPRDELERIAQLQGTNQQIIISTISPDDAAALVALVDPVNETFQLAFLNIQDGSLQSVSDDFENFLFLSNFAWRDATTAVVVVLDFTTFGAGLLAIDRTTGNLASTPIPELEAFPISLSPNGTRLLTAELEEGRAEDETRAFWQSPFDRKLRLHPPRPGQDVPPALRHVLAYQDDGEVESSPDQILLSYFDLNTRQSQPLVRLAENTQLLSQPAWSPDGSRLAMVRMAVDPPERGATSVGNVITQDALGRLPPAENPMLQTNMIDVFSLAPGQVGSRQLRAADGDGDVFLRASWSTDSQRLLVQTSHPARPFGRQHPIYTYRESTALRFYSSDLELLGTLDAPEISAPNLSTPSFVSPGEVLITTVAGLSMRIYYYNLGTGEFRQVSQRDGIYTQVLATRLARQVVFVHSSFLSPPEIYRQDWDGTNLVALTHTNRAAQEANRVQVNTVSFTLASGATRQGYLIQPAGETFPPRNAPIVVWQEGGPGSLMVSQWGAIVERPFNLLPNFGISLLVLPLQGREGWGANFYNDLAGGRNFGAVDVDDGAEAARQMVARGYTSPARLGITGCSYGGYYAAQSISRHPDLYAAANLQCSLLDTITEWQTGFTWLISYLMGSTPSEEPDEYVRDAPGFNVRSIRTPTLIFHGTNDFLPVIIAENFHDDLDAAGVTVRMLKFEDEGHGLGYRANQLLGAQEQIAWFRKHLDVTAPEGATIEIVAAPVPSGEPAAPAAPGEPVEAPEAPEPVAPVVPETLPAAPLPAAPLPAEPAPPPAAAPAAPLPVEPAPVRIPVLRGIGPIRGLPEQ